jgi:hypothetical protein
MGTKTLRHDERSELPAVPEPDQWWQDSAFVVWYAEGAGIGGSFRIGHEPNLGNGNATLWFGLVTDNGRRFRRNTINPLGNDDRRERGFAALGGRYEICYDDRVRLRVRDDVCTADLEIADFYPRTDFFPKAAGSLVEEFASSHFETSGRITGTVLLDGQTYEADGLCHRDRSWGVRRWGDVLLNHRWLAGTVGPELSFGSIAWNGIDGSLRQFGYVVRDGEVTHAQEVDIVVEMEADGLTCRGGRSTLRFGDGDELIANSRPVDGLLFEQHGLASIDGIGPVSVGGRRGFCDLEISTNPRAGTGPVLTAVRAAHVDGLSSRDFERPLVSS